MFYNRKIFNLLKKKKLYFSSFSFRISSFDNPVAITMSFILNLFFSIFKTTLNLSSFKMYPLSRTNLTIYEEGILLLPVFNGYSFVVIYL